MASISFARGIPAPECLPVEELADCAKAALERDGRTILSYGSTLGDEPLREWIARGHGVRRDHERLAAGVPLPARPLRRPRAGDRRAADVRPAAQDPFCARRGAD